MNRIFVKELDSPKLAASEYFDIRFGSKEAIFEKKGSSQCDCGESYCEIYNNPESNEDVCIIVCDRCGVE